MLKGKTKNKQGVTKMNTGIKTTKIELVERAGQFGDWQLEEHTEGFEALMHSRTIMEQRYSPYDFGMGKKPEKYFIRENK